MLAMPSSARFPRAISTPRRICSSGRQSCTLTPSPTRGCARPVNRSARSRSSRPSTSSLTRSNIDPSSCGGATSPRPVRPTESRTPAGMSSKPTRAAPIASAGAGVIRRRARSETATGSSDKAWLPRTIRRIRFRARRESCCTRDGTAVVPRPPRDGHGHGDSADPACGRAARAAGRPGGVSTTATPSLPDSPMAGGSCQTAQHHRRRASGGGQDARRSWSTSARATTASLAGATVENTELRDGGLYLADDPAGRISFAAILTRGGPGAIEAEAPRRCRWRC